MDPTSPIKHVVVIHQENHTFDDLLGQLCQSRPTPCNGVTGPVTFADGNTAANVTEPDIVAPVDHSPEAQTLGITNQWDLMNGCSADPYRCVTHVDPATIPNLTRLATTYAVSDATFAAGDSASYGAHVTLAAGTMDGFAGNNPRPSSDPLFPAHPGWGCASNNDALWVDSATGVQSSQPSCIPSPDSTCSDCYRPTQVPYVPTIMQSMETAGLTWHLYQGYNTTQPTNGSPWSICSYFTWCNTTRNTLAHNASVGAFQDAAAGGRLPNLSLLLPVGGNGQHNGNSLARGDNYIGSIVNAVQTSPQWNSTAIFITYDDCGCFYDHVLPPEGLGLRNPMVIVSAYAKPGYTDSTTAIQPYSMLSFVDHNFGLPALTPAVESAYDYADSFDFTQPPLKPVTMTRTVITARERAALKVAPHGNDGT